MYVGNLLISLCEWAVRIGDETALNRLQSLSRPMNFATPLAPWPTVAVVLIATVTDLRSRRIPNWLVGPFLLAGLALSGYLNGWNGLLQSFLGVLLGGVVMGVFWKSGGMGMGDVKLCMAIGAWIGPSQLFVALVITGLAGGIMALLWALTGGFLLDSVRSASGLLLRLGRNPRPGETRVLSNPAARKMPYAPAIAFGTICSFLGRHG